MTVFSYLKEAISVFYANSREIEQRTFQERTPSKAQWVVRESTYEECTPEFDERSVEES